MPLRRGYPFGLVVLGAVGKFRLELPAPVTEAAVNLLTPELRGAVAGATDSAFVAELLATTTPISASDSPLADIRLLLDAMQLSAASRVYLIISPRLAKRLVTMAESGGTPLFPAMTLNGGTLAGLTVVVSDQLADNVVVAVDAAQLGVDTGTVITSIAPHAAIQMTTGGAFRSLWQRNEIGARVERIFGFQLFRSTATASLQGVDWGGTVTV